MLEAAPPNGIEVLRTLRLWSGFIEGRQIPSLPFFFVLDRGEKCVTGMSIFPQPGNDLYQVRLGHGRAPGGRPVDPAANVKKYRAAIARNGRIGIVTNLDEPMISEIARAHFLVAIIVRRIFWINHDVTIVIGRARIVAPKIGVADLMKWIIAARRELGIVSVDFSDPKNARRRTAIAFLFAKARLILTGQASSPGNAILAKQHRERRGHRVPSASPRPFEELNCSVHRIPIWRDANDKLRAIIRHAGGTCTAPT